MYLRDRLRAPGRRVRDLRGAHSRGSTGDHQACFGLVSRRTSVAPRPPLDGAHGVRPCDQCSTCRSSRFFTASHRRASLMTAFFARTSSSDSASCAHLQDDHCSASPIRITIDSRCTTQDSRPCRSFRSSPTIRLNAPRGRNPAPEATTGCSLVELSRNKCAHEIVRAFAAYVGGVQTSANLHLVGRPFAHSVRRCGQGRDRRSRTHITCHVARQVVRHRPASSLSRRRTLRLAERARGIRSASVGGHGVRTSRDCP